MLARDPEGMSSSYLPPTPSILPTTLPPQFSNRSASFNAPKWSPLKTRTCLRFGGHEINMPVSIAAPWKHDVFRAIRLGSVRGNFDLPLHPKLLIGEGGGESGCALWEAFDFHSGPLVTSHIRAKGLREHIIFNTNSSLRHQLLPLHLTDWKPGVWSLRENVSLERTNRGRNVCALQTRELFSALNI